MFKEKYGSWALVAGGSEGMGGANANYLAKYGINVVIVGRTEKTVVEKCKQLEKDYSVETRGIVQDLGADDAGTVVIEKTKDLEIGMLVYNVGWASPMKFETASVDVELTRLNMNLRTALVLTIHFSKGMVTRKRGGIMLMSSGSGITSMPYIATYAATKAYMMSLGESLWGEMQDYNVDVISILPGNTIGQSFADVPADTPGFMTGAQVVEEAYANLGKYPSYVAGKYNQDYCSTVYNLEARKKMVEQQKGFASQFMG